MGSWFAAAGVELAVRWRRCKMGHWRHLAHLLKKRSYIACKVRVKHVT